MRYDDLHGDEDEIMQDYKDIQEQKLMSQANEDGEEIEC